MIYAISVAEGYNSYWIARKVDHRVSKISRKSGQGLRYEFHESCRVKITCSFRIFVVMTTSFLESREGTIRFMPHCRTRTLLILRKEGASSVRSFVLWGTITRLRRFSTRATLISVRYQIGKNITINFSSFAILSCTIQYRFLNCSNSLHE